MFSFKRTTLFYLLLLAVAVFTASCEQDLVQDDVTPPNSSVQVRENLGAAMSRAFSSSSADSTDTDLDSLCFTFNYPLDLLLTDGTTVSAANDAELAARFADGETSGVFVADFVYPYSVSLADGTEVTIDNFEGLIGVLITCFGDIDDWDDEDWDDEDWGDHGECPEDFDFAGECFVPSYPLTLSVNGASVTIASEEAFEDFLDNLEGDTISEFEFIFPFTVLVLEDSTSVTINTEEDLIAVIEACDFGDWDDEDWDDEDWDDEDWGDWDGEFEFDEFEACFTVNFPLNLLINDEVVTVADEDALFNLFTDSTGVEIESIDLAYPVSVTLVATGEVITINNEEEWEALCDTCHGDDYDDLFGEDCFEVSFPISVVVAGETVSVADEDTLESLFDEISPADFGGLAYPVNVVLTESGDTVTVNNEEEWIQLLISCE